MSVIHPEATPKLVMPFPIKRDLIAGLGVEELVVIPFDREFASRSAEEFVEEELIGRLGRRAACRWGRTSASARAPRARRSSCAARRRDPGGAAGGGRGRDGLLEPHPRPGRRRRGREGRRASWAGRSCSRARWCSGDRRGRELGMPTANIVPDDTLVSPGHGVYAAWAHGHPAAVNVGVRPDLRHRPGPAGGGLPDRLRRRPLRRDAADRVHRADARGEAVRVGRCAGRADAAGRGAGARNLRAAATFPAA